MRLVEVDDGDDEALGGTLNKKSVLVSMTVS
jgi:hypothetical protein